MLSRSPYALQLCSAIAFGSAPWAIACSITADGIAVSKALNTIPDSTTGDITKKESSATNHSSEY